MSSPPLTPIRQYIPNIETSPLPGQSPERRRRSSSYTHNRSPATRRSSYSNHRLSSYSNAISDLATPLDDSGHGMGGGGGGGNLADELEFADEDDEWNDETLDEGVSGISLADEVEDGSWNATGEQSMHHDLSRHECDLVLAAQTDGARDSGIDVAYRASPSSQHSTISPTLQNKPQLLRNFSRPISRDSDVESPLENPFSLEMEHAMTAISRLADPPSNQQDADTISRALNSLQHLSPQTALETNTQRLTTSTNSISSHLAQQTRLIASLSSSLFPPFGISTPLDLAVIDDILPQMAQLVQARPLPDARALQGLTKLDRETTDLLHTLASLTDSLQMGKHTTSNAARQLRNTHAMVTQLRMESDMAEQAKWRIEKEGWDRKLADRWCARECSDVLGGFEQVCEGLRRGLEERVAA